ncbi:MAG: hypothetical protein ACR2NR_09080 [Solirubrobacteraceae bacterium]
MRGRSVHPGRQRVRDLVEVGGAPGLQLGLHLVGDQPHLSL